ncbi:MAG TPA: site-2 protease family protein [Gaiellaceae bacterium]
MTELTPEERARLAELSYYEPPEPVRHEPRFPFLRKLLGPFIALGALLLKFGGVLLKFKFLFSIFVSAAFYVWFGGWWFGLGLVALLFVHEMGHVLEARRQGLPVSAPLFIPFLGAMITMREMPQDAWNEAKVAIAGPIVGSLGAAAIWLAGIAFDSNHLKALAFLGFLINLFNLLPIVPLDGGRIVAALHPGLWLVGFIALLGLVVLSPNPILIIILVISGMELWQRWRMRSHPELESYYRVTAQQRLIIGVLYFGLAALLVLGMEATHLPRDVLR